MTDTDELREMIEEIDQTIIENIAMRMEIADKLAEAKKQSSQQYWDESKEKEVINHGRFTFTVVKVVKYRIAKVKVTVSSDE